MDINYLQTVVAVAENLSYSKAAHSVNCSQSSVSRQVSIVENELGTSVFNHIKGGKVELTEYGKKAIPMIKEILSSYTYLLDNADKASGHFIHNFRLGLYRGPFSHGAKEIIVSTLYLKHPEILLTLSECKKEDATEKLLSGKLDAALLYCAFWKNDENNIINNFNDNIEIHELFIKYPCIAMAKDHPLAKNGSVGFEDLKYEDILFSTDITSSNKKEWGIQHDAFLKSCILKGFTPKIKVVPDNPSTDLRNNAVITNGWMYPTFLTSSVKNMDSIVFVPVRDPIYYVKYYLMVPKNQRPGTRAVESFLKEFLQQNDPSCAPL